MSKEPYIKLALGVYKVSELFSKKESLKNDLRTLADEILVSLLCNNQKGCSEDIKLIQKLFDLAENRHLADSRNFLVLRREYSRIAESFEEMGEKAGKGGDNSFQSTKNKKRQKAILGILKANSKVKMADLAKNFPGLNRRTLLRDMSIFCQAGMIEKNGIGRGAHYNVRNATL